MRSHDVDEKGGGASKSSQPTDKLDCHSTMIAIFFRQLKEID